MIGRDVLGGAYFGVRWCFRIGVRETKVNDLAERPRDPQEISWGGRRAAWESPPR